jgi:hypothetical protein
MPKSRSIPRKVDRRSKRSIAPNRGCLPKRLQFLQVTRQEHDSKNERNSLKEILQSWIPTDSNAFMFELVVVTYLIVGIFYFIQKEDGSMLTTLLPYVSAYVGLTKVKPLLPWGERGNKST